VTNSVSDNENDDPLLELEEELLTARRQAELKRRKEGCNLSLWLQGVTFYYVALPVIRARWVILSMCGVYIMLSIVMSF